MPGQAGWMGWSRQDLGALTQPPTPQAPAMLVAPGSPRGGGEMLLGSVLTGGGWGRDACEQGPGEVQASRGRQRKEQSCCLHPTGFGLLVQRGQSHQFQLSAVCGSMENAAKKLFSATEQLPG